MYVRARRDAERCDIQIRLPEVSKVQAKLKADGQAQVWAENMSATNPGGTQLNGEALAQSRMLTDGDVLSICGRHFRFEYMSETPAALEDQTVAIDAYARARAVKAPTPKAAKPAADPPPAQKENEDASRGGATPGRGASTPGVGRTPGRTPLVDKEVRSALAARRSKILGDGSAPSTPSDGATGAAAEGAVRSAKKSDKRKSSLGLVAKSPFKPAADGACATARPTADHHRRPPLQTAAAAAAHRLRRPLTTRL